MPYAVVQLQGKQYRVEPGTILEVDRLDTDQKKTFSISDVLLVVTDKKTSIGTPLVKDAVVKTEVLGDTKAKKIRVATYKAKSRYRRVKGHRQSLTRLKVVSIVAK